MKPSALLGALAATVLLTTVAWAESPAPSDSDKVVDVQIEGLKRIESEAALAGVKSKAGSKLDEAQITEDLRTVWATGFFRDVRVEKQRVAGGWRLVFAVVEKPSVKEVKYEGNDDLSEDDIKAVVDVKPFTILNIDQLKRNVEKIKDLYLDKGHYLAEVSYRIDPVPDNAQEATVVFHIAENAKVVVRQITLLGNRALSSDEIKGVIQTREGSELSFLTQAGTFKEEYFQTDLMRIQALYYDHGYVAVKLGQPTTTISTDRRFIYISVPIEEGEQYRIGKVSFAGDVVLRDASGKAVTDESTLRRRLSITSGAIFNRSQLFEDIQKLTDVYRDQGYAYANVTPNSTLNGTTRVVDLDLEVERGELVTIQRIEIVGNTRTRDKVIRREIRLAEGERYSASALDESRARIYQLGYFETVNVATHRGEKPDQMDVTVEIKEKSTGTFQVGAGFSSVEKFIMTAQISQDDFLGNGQLLQISAQLSFGNFARRLATLQFFEPYFLDTEWSLGLSAYRTQQYYGYFHRDATGGSPRFGYRLTPDLHLSVGYTLEWIGIVNDLTSGPVLSNINREGRNSAVNASITYDTRDNRLFPSSGHYHVLTGELSDRSIFSDPGLEYRSLQLFLRYYYPLPFSFVLKLNAEFGIIFGRGDAQVPLSERFFPGGIYSVRGFQPRSLGPFIEIPGGADPISGTTRVAKGGNKQTVFNLELEFPIIAQAQIKGVLFADAGNAYDEDEGFFYVGTPKHQQPWAYMARSGERIKPPLGLYYSVGFGLRWLSPMGPLRFEWGIPITKRELGDPGVDFQFTIGNMF